MKKPTILLALSLILGSVPATAQKATPKTDIAVPSDTTKTKRPEIKPEPESPQIELPDVLILGKDQYHRTVKDKKALAPETPELMRREASYEPLSTWFSRETNKPGLGDNDTLSTRQIWGALKGGSYYTFDGDAGYWQKLKQGDALASFWIDRSEGQYSNSTYAEGGLSGKFSYEAAPKVMSIARAEYSRYSRGLQTAAYGVDNSVRTGGVGRFALDLQYDVNSLSDGNLGFELGGLSMDSRANGSNIDRTDDFYYDVHFDYTRQIKTTQLSAHGQYVHESLEATADSSSLVSSMATVGAEVLQPISTVFSGALGADYHIFNQDTLYTKSRLSPYARINLMPGDQVGLSLKLSTGLKYDTFMHYWENNFYLAHTLPLRPSEERFGLALKADIKISDQVKFFGGYSRRWMDVMYFWQADSTTGLIGLNELNDVNLSEIQIGLAVELSKKTHLHIDYIDYSDKIPVTAGETLFNLNRLPYRADFRLPIRASIQLLPQLNLTLTADILGSRKKNISTAETLPAFGLFHADMNLKIAENISALLSVRNLLDAKYVMWQGYPEMGVIIAAGLRARF